MGRALVIVESPAKAKTIEKFLGRRYHVAASMGHVRDLPKSQLGVDIEAGFAPRYITIRGKGDVVQRLREEARKAEKVFLATDPDREGEAISWHLAHLLDIPPTERCRVTFNEITKEAVRKAFEEPRSIDMNLVDAQQARRVLDRLVGYQLSPLLWRKVRRGLSAGRVQSVAVRLICDREEEIERFLPEEYWTLTARLRAADARTGGDGVFAARFYGSDGQKLALKDQGQTRAIMEEAEGAVWRVASVQRKERRRQPAPPFTTSSLQQEASRKLGFSVSRTMRVAQELYEGVEIKGEGSVGLVTYIRTDSTRVSAQAVEEAREWITRRFGGDFSAPRAGGGKAAAHAQDAHEAIRPTSVYRAPDDIKDSLTRDQYRLYKLIWERFLASQMSHAVLDTVTADIAAGHHLFRATGSTVKFPGFMLLYIEGRDEEDKGEDEEGAMLPDLVPGQELALVELVPEQHFTQPPSRYTEAALVKALEEKGIGRPSTYAPIIATIQERGYVTKENRHFRPTELGKVVTALLKEHFPDIVSVEFTAGMEKQLDEIEEGRYPWQEVVGQFYDSFARTLARADAAIERVQVPAEASDEVCEVCGRPMVIKFGRFGLFLACSGYPECRATRPIREKVEARCPRCGGELVERRSRKGRRFYGCATYPACDFVSWSRPVGNCPRCGGILVERGGRAGRVRRCAEEACGYEERGEGAVEATAAHVREGR